MPDESKKPECVILVGLPASGKSSFFQQEFRDTHVRVNGDMLRTKNREKVLLEACLHGLISFVVDKANPTREERASIVQAAQAARFRVSCYFMESLREECLVRNQLRQGKARIRDGAVYDFAARLQRPTMYEGFDELHFVRMAHQGDQFVIYSSIYEPAPLPPGEPQPRS